MKVYLPPVLFFAVFLIFSCSKSKDIITDTPASDCDSPVLVDADLYDSAPSDEFQFHSVSIDGNCLKLAVQYGGGCEEVIFQLIDASVVMESFPIQRNVRLSLEDNDPCEALVTQELSYDLTPLQVDGYSKIILNLQDFDGNLVYNY